MKTSQLARFCAWSLGIVVFCSLPSYAESSPNFAIFETAQFRSEADQVFSPEQQRILTGLKQAKVVYLGETHDSPEDHQAQLAIIQALHQQNPQVAIAMEMFQRPYQEVVNRYLAGELTEAELQAQSQYKQRWGYDWEYYAPILRFAKANQLPVIALNTPTEVIRKVSREGLNSLTPTERQFIPPFSEIRTDNAEYRQMIRDIYDQAHHGHGSSRGFEKFFLAQVLWDETMAEGVVQFLQAQPDYQVVVLAGQGHVVYGYGIPSRVARRMSTAAFTQRSVLLSATKASLFQPQTGDKPNSGNRQKIADYLWVIE
ncbi:MAG: ChaN family lipoprotein [Leptolyngbyaceae bacterium]|nr:ChaN family lipoprotein [Leptolyngbyaceae bacterium]